MTDETIVEVEDYEVVGGFDNNPCWTINQESQAMVVPYGQ